jgi:putative transposase
MYYWRKLSPEDRQRILSKRKAQQRPWHSPPHKTCGGRYMLTASCFEHAYIIGTSPQRMADFEETLLEVLDSSVIAIYAWAVLPNHYHALVSLKNTEPVIGKLARLHGRSSYSWNREDNVRGRQVWCGAAETRMKSDRHFWSSLNYILHNPVKHGYAKKWTDWPFSNAASYLADVGKEKAAELWREHDISAMGDDWDL